MAHLCLSFICQFIFGMVVEEIVKGEVSKADRTRKVFECLVQHCGGSSRGTGGTMRSEILYIKIN